MPKIENKHDSVFSYLSFFGKLGTSTLALLRDFLVLVLHDWVCRRLMDFPSRGESYESNSMALRQGITLEFFND